MFGLNDTNQNENNKPSDKTAPLPANPFLDNPPTSAPQAGQPALASMPTMGSEPPLKTPAPSDSDSLVSLKEKALNSLAPLVNHLDQTPDERFKTTMMLIQASDNSNLIKEAYEAANKIPDEKTRAQALLDIVNEINYFTQKENKEQ